MSAIRNLPIARKFTFAFGIVCSLCVALGTYTFITFQSISAETGAVGGDDFPSVVHLTDIRGAMNEVRLADLGQLLCQSPECRARSKEKRDKGISDFQAAIKAYEPFDSDLNEQALTGKLTSGFGQYLEFSNRGVALLAAGKNGPALDLLTANSTVEPFNAAVAASEDDIQINVKSGLNDAIRGAKTSSRATWLNVVATLLIVLLCAVIGVTLTREIAPRIDRLKIAVQAIADKDLTASVRVTGTDEIGQLGEAFNSSVASIRSVLESVAQGADRLSAATTQISARSVQNAGNAHAESSKINQIAAATQEMTATIGEISHNAESAALASRSSAETADKGGTVMQAATATMEKIAAATSSVAEKMTSLAHRSEEIGKSSERDPGDQRTDQPAGFECGN